MLIGEYASVIRRIAASMVQGQQVDASARGQDDYVAELCTVAWEAKWAFRARHPGQDERRYVLKTLWNASRRWCRRRRTPERLFDRSAMIPETLWDPVGRLEARDALSRIASCLSPLDVKVLLVEDGPNQRMRQRRVVQARRRAAEVLA